MFKPEFSCVAKGVHKSEVGHICYGSKSYQTIGHVFRGIVFVINPVPSPDHMSTGGVVPLDYMISTNPVWLYGNHKGKSDPRGVNLRKVHDLWQAQFYERVIQECQDKGLPIPDAIGANCAPAAYKTVTLPEFAFTAAPGGTKQVFSFLPDEAFEREHLSMLRTTGIGLALAATRYTGCSLSVISGLDVLRQDSAIYNLFKSWVDKVGPSWLYSFEPNEFLPRYKSPNKSKEVVNNFAGLING